MTIGEKIRGARTERGFTQRKLAEMCGISEPAIRNYELGNRTPCDEALTKIATALDWDAEYFFDTSFIENSAQLKYLLKELAEKGKLSNLNI